MKYLNQTIMKATQKIRLKITKKADLIIKKNMKHKKMMREKRKYEKW